MPSDARKDIDMSAPRFTDEVLAIGVSGGRRSALPAIIAVLLACCAVLAGVVWGPFVLIVASNLRPVTSRPGAIPPPGEIDAARQQMWTVVIVSFVALAVLAGVALAVARWAFPTTASTSARRSTWAIRCLVGGLVIGFAPVVLAAARVSLPISSYGNTLLTSLTLAGAVAGFILSGIALPSAAASADSPNGVRIRGGAAARACLVASIVVACVVAFLIAASAQFIVGFFLHLVW
jgi:hypothetical protein